MKTLISYEYFNKNIYYGFMYSKRVKSNLLQGTPTLLINVSDTENALGRNYHMRGVCNAHCRACDSLMIIPDIDWLVIRAGRVTCPCCGHIHTLEHTMISKDEDRFFPLNLKVKLVEMKNRNIELRLSYVAESLGKNVYTDFSYDINVEEKFIFNCLSKTVMWIRNDSKGSELKQEIGYLDDLRNDRIKSALEYIPYKLFDKNGQKISKLLKILRDKINLCFSQQGYSKKDLYVVGEQGKIVFDSVLYCAYKTRFWDSEGLKEFYAHDRHYLKGVLARHNMNDLGIVEKGIESLMSTGESFVNAFIKYFNLPNVKLVRKNINYFKVIFLKQAYSLKNTDVGNLYYPYLERMRIKYEDVKCYYDNLGRLYPKLKDSSVLNYFLRSYESNDMINLYKMLDKVSKEKLEKNVPRLQDLHDYLSVLVTGQKDRELIYDIPKEIINRFDMEIQNTRCEVLKKFSEVKKVGLSLHNCAVSYRNRINDSLQLVAMTDKKGKAIALLRIENKVIREAKLMNNQPIHTNKEYQQVLFEFAEKAELKISTNDVIIDRNKIIKIA